jgi:hypothetical protein
VKCAGVFPPDLEHILRGYGRHGRDGVHHFSKLAARREKDLAFVGAFLGFQTVRVARLRSLIGAVEDAPLRERLDEALVLCQRR